MKLRKALIGTALAAALMLPAVQPASAAQVLSVEGRNVWSEANTRIVGKGTAYVSIRTVAGLLAPEAVLSWENGTAWARGDGLTLSAKPGDVWLTVNDRALYIPDGVLAENGRVLVPIRVLAEALGGTVDWSAEEGITLTVGSGQPAVPAYREDELYWMSRIISAESQGEPLLGKLAVGTVVLNRVASDEYPDTIYGVIFDSRWGDQFQPVTNGTVYHEPTAESVLAAKLVLDGARAARDSLYFLAPDLTDNHWIMENREFVVTIGCHWFYR